MLTVAALSAATMGCVNPDWPYQASTCFSVYLIPCTRPDSLASPSKHRARNRTEYIVVLYRFRPQPRNCLPDRRCADAMPASDAKVGCLSQPKSSLESRLTTSNAAFRGSCGSIARPNELNISYHIAFCLSTRNIAILQYVELIIFS